MTDLSEMRRIAEAATPGPWGQDDYENWRVGAEGWWVAYCGPEPPDPNPLKSERDAAYIATFDPPTVLALLDAAALLEKTIYRVEGYTGPPVWWDAEAREILSRL